MERDNNRAYIIVEFIDKDYNNKIAMHITEQHPIGEAVEKLISLDIEE